MVLHTIKSKLNVAITKIIKNKYWTFASIPIIAGAVGYVTNYVGVQMLFYPIEYQGLKYKRNVEQPYGFMFTGWQGVVPCKRVIMANSMVDVTLSKLLNIKELFSKLQPQQMSDILAKSIGEVIYYDTVPTPIVQYFLKSVSLEVIQQIEQLISVKDIVVEGMTRDPTTMGKFFQRVGRNELDFLVTSGSYFGFLLGLIQMVCWRLYPQSWCLPVGGAAGMFLKRQDAVSADISEYLADHILTSEKIWRMILCGENAEDFVDIVRRIVPVLTEATVQDVVCSLKEQLLGLKESKLKQKKSTVANDSTSLNLKTMSMSALVPVDSGIGISIDTRCSVISTLHPLHSYINHTLDIEATLTERSKSLTSHEFERILHPVFEQEEVLLVMAGGVLGFVAGLMQWVGVVYSDLYYDTSRRLKYMNKYTYMIVLLKKFLRK